MFGTAQRAVFLKLQKFNLLSFLSKDTRFMLLLLLLSLTMLVWMKRQARLPLGSFKQTWMLTFERAVSGKEKMDE